MSSLIVNSKIFSLGGEMWVTDESGNHRYQVKGSFLKFPKQFRIYNMDGQELGKVMRKVISFLPKFYLEIGGSQVAVISQKFSLLKPKFDIEAMDVTVLGNIWEMNFEIKRKGMVIGRIDRKWFSIRNQYRIEVLSERDELLVLGLVLAINYVISANEANNTTTSS